VAAGARVAWAPPLGGGTVRVGRHPGGRASGAARDVVCRPPLDCADGLSVALRALSAPLVMLMALLDHPPTAHGQMGQRWRWRGGLAVRAVCHGQAVASGPLLVSRALSLSVHRSTT